MGLLPGCQTVVKGVGAGSQAIARTEVYTPVTWPIDGHDSGQVPWCMVLVTGDKLSHIPVLQGMELLPGHQWLSHLHASLQSKDGSSPYWALEFQTPTWISISHRSTLVSLVHGWMTSYCCSEGIWKRDVLFSHLLISLLLLFVIFEQYFITTWSKEFYNFPLKSYTSLLNYPKILNNLWYTYK